MLVDDPSRPVPRPEQRHHLERVLRLRPGELVVAFDGRGSWAPCRFTGGPELEAEGPVTVEPAPSPSLTVAFVPVKGDRPEWAVQKLAEIGVDRIVLLRSARSVVRWEGSRERAALERLRRVAAEATAQSRRVYVPEVEGVIGLDALDPATTALADPGGGAPLGAATCVAVGPEGGWSDEERAGGRPTVSLGEGVLRAETAAVVAGALLAARRAGTVEPGTWPGSGRQAVGESR